MQRRRFTTHLGVSNVAAEQIAEAQSIAPVVCVQNFYNIANRRDDALIDSLAEQGIGYVPFLPARWFYTAAIRNVVERRHSFKCQANERCVGVAASTFAEHSAHSHNIISGTPERENVAGASLQLPHEAIKELNHAALLRWPGANFTAGRGRAWEGGRGPKLGISAIQQSGTLLMN